MLRRVRFVAAAIAATLVAHAHAQDAAPAETTGPTRVYTLELKGEFGRDVALRPVKEAVDEARALRADVLLVRFDCEFVPTEAPGGADVDMVQLDLAREMAALFTEDAKRQEASPRLAFWIKRAHGGAALLAFASPEIYYTSDAVHDATGAALPYDPLAGQRQQSMRLGRAQGLALAGGHSVEIFNAMIRTDYVLSADFLNGKPSFHEDTTGATLLTSETDRLILDADLALRLRLSRGTADTEEQLFKLMKLDAAKVERVGDGDAIFDRWRDDLLTAEQKIRTLRRRYDGIEIASPGGYDQRAAARQERLEILGEINELLVTYGDSVRKANIGADPFTLTDETEVAIGQLKKQQQLDRPE